MFESHNVWRHFTHLVNRVDYRHALPIFHITSTYRACPAVHRRADGVGLYCDACVEGWIVIAGICHDSVRSRADSDRPECFALTKKTRPRWPGLRCCRLKNFGLSNPLAAPVSHSDRDDRPGKAAYQIGMKIFG